MKITRMIGVACAGAITLLVSVTANAAIVYNLNRSIGAGTVTGFIETDGTIGLLRTANITDWLITLTAPNLLGDSPQEIAKGDSFFNQTVVSGNALTASETALTFNFDAAGTNNLFLSGRSPKGFWCIEVTGCATGGFPGETIGRDARFDDPTYTEIAPRSGAIEFAVSEVPLPTAAWLYGWALLGLGVINRKRV